MIVGKTSLSVVAKDPDLVFFVDAGHAASGVAGLTGGNGTWYDLSGNGKNFTPEFGEPGWRDERRGLVSFAGAETGNSDHVSVDVNLLGSDMSNTTMFAIVKQKRSGGAIDLCGIVHSRGGGGGVYGMQASTNLYGAAGPTGCLGYEYGTQSAPWQYSSGLEFPLNEWCFIAMSVDTSVGADFYMGDADNGLRTATHSFSSYGSKLPAMRTTRIGADTGGLGISQNRGWNGDIASAGMFTRTMNSDEIEKIYDSFKSRFGI